MTRLTQVAISSRKFIRYTIFFVIFLLVGRIILVTSISIYRKIFPPPPPAPTVKWGRLTKIPFPTVDKSPKLTFTLETPTGGLPTDIPTQEKVYFMPRKDPNLLSLDLSKEKAKDMGFAGEPQKVSDTVYRFPNLDTPVRIEMNIIEGTFSIAYDLNTDRTPIDGRPPLPEVAASEFRSLLSAGNVLPDDLTGSTQSDFLKLEGGKLVGAISLSESNVTRVNLFRKDYDKMPSVTQNPDQANVWAIVGGSTDQAKQVIAAEYHYFSIDESQTSTYPIKTPDAAYNELTAGNAFIADLGVNKDGDSLKIRKVFLAHFDPNQETQFFQPIYVFEGDNGFTAYVPAVTSDYYGD